MSVSVGSLVLPNPVMAASGTYGSGTEFAAYADPSLLGAVVVKSLSASPWRGHPGPNLQGLNSAVMLNAVGLANPGVSAWAEEGLRDLLAAGARVVASLWGRSVHEYAETALKLQTIAGPIAWEINLSCPNLEDPRRLVAHNSDATAEVVSAICAVAPRDIPVWAKLSPNTADLVDVAEAAAASGAEAVTLINTLSGMAIDTARRSSVLANTYGGVSGPLLHPVAVRAVHQVHQALPDLPVIGVGGVSTGQDALQLLMAGASAIEVGTANFYDPRATHRVLKELTDWCAKAGVNAAEIVGVVRGGPIDEIRQL